MWSKRKIWKRQVFAPGEVIYEIVAEDDNAGWGIACAFIRKSEPHFHKDMRERYILLEGKLLVYVGENQIMLDHPFDQIAIPKGAIHWAEALPEGSNAKVLVISMPAWSKTDHHKVGKKDAAQ